MAAQQSLLLSMSKLSPSKFCHCTQCSVDAWIFVLLWKLPQMPSCNTNNANLDKTNFEMFYKIDCCAAIHGQIWMNSVRNESRMIVLSCTEKNWKFCDIFFFNFEKFGVKPGFSFFKLTLYTMFSGILCMFSFNLTKMKNGRLSWKNFISHSIVQSVQNMWPKKWVTLCSFLQLKFLYICIFLF